MKSDFDVRTSTRTQLIDITATVRDFVAQTNVESGSCTVFVPHTTAAVTINENADPSVKTDITAKLSKLIPHQDDYQHLEGNSDAHVKSTLTGASVTVLIDERRLLLGTWQGIMFCEYDGPRQRRFIVKVQSD
jgi:secondary thiamine-phosphate synthase enzyme